MANYKSDVNYVDDNINNNVVTLSGTHRADGVNLIEFEPDEVEVTIHKAADGTGYFVEKPSKSGTVRLHLLKASATNTHLWDIIKSGNSSFSFSWKNTSMPEFDCSCSNLKISGRPMMSEQGDPQFVEWEMLGVYVDYVGAGFVLKAT